VVDRRLEQALLDRRESILSSAVEPPRAFEVTVSATDAEAEVACVVGAPPKAWVTSWRTGRVKGTTLPVTHVESEPESEAEDGDGDEGRWL